MYVHKLFLKIITMSKLPIDSKLQPEWGGLEPITELRNPK